MQSQTKIIKNKVHREDKAVYPNLRALLFLMAMRETERASKVEQDAQSLNPSWLQAKNRSLIAKHRKRNKKRQSLNVPLFEPPKLKVLIHPAPVPVSLVDSCVPYSVANAAFIRKRMKPEESDSGESDAEDDPMGQPYDDDCDDTEEALLESTTDLVFEDAKKMCEMYILLM